MNWRSHPGLKERFQPDHPDDLQVIVHDGGPRITESRPEVVWVTVTACIDDIFTGRVLNQPSQLRTIHEGQEISFIVAGRLRASRPRHREVFAGATLLEDSPLQQLRLFRAIRRASGRDASGISGSSRG